MPLVMDMYCMKQLREAALFLFIFSLLMQYILGQGIDNTGYKYYKNYSHLEYDHHPQNFCIAQDRRGMIYVGNRGGLLVFDGVSWELKYVPNNVVYSMAIAEDGRIYIGGQDEIGCFTPGAGGSLKYISLTHQVDEKFKNFSRVSNTAASEEGVYFKAKKHLFRWNFSKIDGHWPGSFGLMARCDERLYIQKGGVGLMTVENDSLIPLPGTESLAKKRVWVFAPFGNQKEARGFLVGTRGRGLLIYDQGRLTPFITQADGYLKKHRISMGIQLSTGDYAVATRLGGIVILDAGGRLKYLFNQTRGLQDNNVEYIFEDRQGNLWMALVKGISRLEYRSPFYHYDARGRLKGMALSVTKHKNHIYAGTMQGLYVLHPDTGHFTPLAGIGTCWDLLSTGESLLTAAENGVFQIDTPTANHRRIYNDQAIRLMPSAMFPGHIWCASRTGLAALVQKNKRWVTAHRYRDIREDLRSIVEDPGGHLWLAATAGLVIKASFPAGIEEPAITRFRQETTPFGEEVYLAQVADHVVFATSHGLFRCEEEKNTFIPDHILGKDFAGGPEAEPVFRIVQDRDSTIWFHSRSRNYRAVPAADNIFKIDRRTFRRVPIIQVNSIYPEPGGDHTWFAGTEGLMRFDRRGEGGEKEEFPALVRRVLVNEEELIFGGYESGEKTVKAMPVLSYSRRNIGFLCGVPFFQEEPAARFRYFLGGYDRKWSPWTAESRRYYTNLDAGRYTFRVQAKNVYGDLSREDTFSFKVLPPWYQTWWAYLIYAAAFLLLFYLAVRWRSGKLEREKERLERVVAERTREVREQSEKLKEMDRVKSRFFANISHEFRTPLTLVMSPLEQLLSRSKDFARKKVYRLMLRNLHILLTFINQLLDLSRLDSGKMKLNPQYRDIVPLIKGALASFRMPAEHKQLTLAFHCPEEKILLPYDHEKMEEVMYNLVGNALKFTPGGGKISVSISLAGSPPVCVKISVKDTGPGIPGDQLGKVFDRFYQVGDKEGDTGKGTGIGLALSKEIVLLHNGKIDVFSSEGKGAEFVVRLPLGKPQLEPGKNIPAAGKVTQRSRAGEIAIMYPGEEDEEYFLQDSSGEIEKGGEESTMILVVEDHDDMRSHICDSLHPDYRVITAKNGKEGMAKARECIPDLVVSDIMMPELDGYELCRRLKKDIGTSHIPIILLTAKAGEESIIRGYGTGADDYVTKPFNTNLLAARIKNLIDLRRQMQLKIQREKMLLPSKVSVSSQDDQFLRDFQGFIEKNLDNPELNIDTLCEKLLIGRATLFRKIQALTGQSPNQFIQSYRLERGAQLLRENYGNVTEVAYAVGFSSSQYFASCFKEKFHQSPKAYQAGESRSQSTGEQYASHL